MIKRSALLVRTAVLVGLAASLAVAPADARVGGGASSGSRGGRTFSAPPSTATAPSSVQPMQRTETPSLGASRPGMAAAAPAAAGSRFGGFGGGMMAGLLGAGVLGMMMGHGFFGGIGGLMSIFGFLFQIALIGGLVWLAVRFFRRRSEPAFAGAGAPYTRSTLGGMPAGGSGMNAAQPQRAPEPVVIGPADYAAFEANLVQIQNAYGKEDLAKLAQLATPEMVRYFASDLEENRRRGNRNEVSDAKLLQGDLAESWREGPVEYATVAMRFSILDAMVDRQTGRTVSGDLNRPSEVREVWTFRRERGSAWQLSAIQQAS